MQNGPQLYPDKSEVTIIETANLLQSTKVKVLSVVLDRRLTFDKHACQP